MQKLRTIVPLLLLLLLTSHAFADKIARSSLSRAVGERKVVFELEELGQATGEFANLRLENQTGKELVVEVPVGTVLAPELGQQARMVSKPVSTTLQPGVPKTIPLEGCCIEYGAPVPVVGSKHTYTIFSHKELEFMPPDRFSQQQVEDLESIVNLIVATQQLEKEGRLNGDLGEVHAQTVMQRAVWVFTERNSEKPHDKKKLWADINLAVKNNGGKQTPEQVEELAGNLWDDVNLVTKQAGVKQARVTKDEEMERQALEMLGGRRPFDGNGHGTESGRFRLPQDVQLQIILQQRNRAQRLRELAGTTERNLRESTHFPQGLPGGRNDYHLTTWRDSSGRLKAFVYVSGNTYIVLREDGHYATNLDVELGQDDIGNYQELTLHNGDTWKIRTNGIPSRVSSIDRLPLSDS